MGATRGFAVSIAAVGAALLLWVPTAGAAARFANPSGSGSLCTEVAPCDIVTAINKAAEHDDVTIEPGTYGPLSTGMSDSGHPLSIHGQAGAPRPVIDIVSAGIILGGAGSSLSDVELDVSSVNSFGLYSYGYAVNVDRVFVHALGGESEACEIFPATTLTNSVCVADGPKSYALVMYSSNLSSSAATLRNDTLEALGGSGSTGGWGAAARATGGYAAKLTVINTIAHGSRFDLLAEADSNALSEGSITAEHSNYLTDETVTGGGKATVTHHGTSTNQTAVPLFANTAIDDFHERPGSPTLSAGFGSPANGAFDLDGNPRQLGGTTDIGAYQFVPPPTCQTLAAATPFGQATALQLQCTDALGAPLSSYALLTRPTHGTAALNAASGAVTYTPAPGYSGLDSFTFNAASSHGTGAPATATITIGAPPVQPPAITTASLTNKRFRVGKQATAISAKTPLGTSFRFTLSTAAKLQVTITHTATGLSHGHSCLAPSAKLRRAHAKRCTRTLTVGTLTRASEPREPTALPSADASVTAPSPPAPTARCSWRPARPADQSP